jgi:dynein heavy chain
MEFRHELNNDAFRFLMTGGLSLSDKLPDHPSTKLSNTSWLSAKNWGEICRLSDVEGFENFYASFYDQQTFTHY